MRASLDHRLLADMPRSAHTPRDGHQEHAIHGRASRARAIHGAGTRGRIQHLLSKRKVTDEAVANSRRQRNTTSPRHVRLRQEQVARTKLQKALGVLHLQLLRICARPCHLCFVFCVLQASMRHQVFSSSVFQASMAVTCQNAMPKRPPTPRSLSVPSCFRTHPVATPQSRADPRLHYRLLTLWARAGPGAQGQ